MLDGSVPKERDLQFYELDLLKHATHRGYRRHEGRDLTDMELLAKLQHHGAATRLVDATRNAFVALWFAVSADEDKTGILLGVHTSHLCGYEGEPEERHYEEVIKECGKDGNTFTWEPTSVTNRVAAQHSQFLYSSLTDDPKGSLRLHTDPDCALILAIDPKIKKTGKEILIQTFDIHQLTLFPDLDGFSRAYSHSLPVFSESRW